MARRLHKFRAPTLDEAFRAMNNRLGPEAKVVNTQDVREGGVGGFMGRKMVELTAAAPPAPETEAKRRLSPVERKYAGNSRAAQTKASAIGEDTVAYFRQLVSDAQHRIASGDESATSEQPRDKPDAIVPFEPRQGPAPDTMEQVLDQMREMREMLQILVAETPGADLPPEYAPHYRTLLKCGVTRKAAATIVNDVIRGADEDLLRDPVIFKERLAIEIRKRARCTGGIGLTAGQRKVVALVGATGVGKTTNLAKLAARFAVRERARVALVTTDTYRIAAPDQLRVYANIIGLPMKIVNSPDEMKGALEAFADYDLILMDTAGGSQFNETQIAELHNLLEVAAPDEVLLVMSTNTHCEELQTIVGRFEPLKPTSLFFTKLDETERYGGILSLLTETDLPLSYLSVGQNVPDDLTLAHAGMITNLILEGGDRRGRSSSKTA